MRQYVLVVLWLCAVAAPVAASSPVGALLVPGGVAEGDSGVRTLGFGARWMALPGLNGPYELQWQTVDGSAASGVDYIAASGRVSLSPQQSFVPLQVEVIGDVLVESSEDIRITYQIVGTNVAGEARLWIHDDDGTPAPPPPPISVVHALDGGTMEPASGSTLVALGFVRHGPLSQPLELSYTLDPSSTASLGSDWQGPSSGVLRFEPGESWRRIELTVLADAQAAAVETVRYQLSAAPQVQLPRRWVSALIRDHVAGAGNTAVGVIACRRALRENDGPARFVIRRVGDASAALSIQYASVDGSATAGADYTPVSGSLNWPAADAGARVINVSLASDNTVEPPESFSLSLTAPAGVGLVPGSAHVIVLDAHDQIMASDFTPECLDPLQAPE